MRHFFSATFLCACICTFISAEDTNKLILQLKNKDPEIRRMAAKALGESGEDDAKVVGALILGLQDKDTFVRRFSAQSLGNLKTQNKEAIPALAALLNSAEEKKENQNAAAISLGKIGSSSFSVLHSAFMDKSKPTNIREKAIEALGTLGKDGKSAVPDLMETLKDEELRFASAVALGKIGSEAKQAKESLKMIVEDKKQRDKSFKDAASAALKNIGN
jgi:HEAT repeat protein